jgi:hypothetical protein
MGWPSLVSEMIKSVFLRIVQGLSAFDPLMYLAIRLPLLFKTGHSRPLIFQTYAFFGLRLFYLRGIHSSFSPSFYLPHCPPTHSTLSLPPHHLVAATARRASQRPSSPPPRRWLAGGPRIDGRMGASRCRFSPPRCSLL